jgi:hypothetical protein
MLLQALLKCLFTLVIGQWSNIMKCEVWVDGVIMMNGMGW